MSPRACPEGRQSRSTKLCDDRAVLDVNTYVPYFLAAIDGALARSASQYYRQTFGIGIGEWRVLSVLADEPGALAARVCQLISLDKAAVSRSLARLEAQEYVVADAPFRDQRRRQFHLTEAGQDLHDKVLEIALEREARLIAGVDPDDLEAMLRAMRIMRANVAKF